MQFQPMNDVSHFPPGHYAKFTKHLWGYEEERTPYLSIESKPSSYEQVYKALCQAVQKRVNNTERPVACLLSGGLDSSLVAGLAARYCKQQGKVLETYSIGLPGSEDLKFSSKVAEHIGSQHTQILSSEDEFLYSIPQVIKDIESYDTTSVRASVGNWNVGKYIRDKSDAKVVLNGDGADELMGGYLYFHACPGPEEFDKECRRLLKDIHCFDVLRSDKSISSHGLEPRTPYLDKGFVNAYLNLPLHVRYGKGKPEKHVIRSIIEAFDPTLIPREVLFRKKEAFSDGVSSLQKSWYQTIQERIPSMEKTTYLHNQPQTDEQYYYRSLFEQYHPGCATLIPYFWMPRYVNATDASARTLSQYKESNPLNE
jgi:asparagine synthase (glutamine-hydrolysing)